MPCVLFAAEDNGVHPCMVWAGAPCIVPGHLQVCQSIVIVAKVECAHALLAGASWHWD